MTKQLFCTPSDHHLPSFIPTLWIAYSQLSYRFGRQGQQFVVPELAGVSGVLVVWLLVHSLKTPTTMLVRTYIDDQTTILHAIRTPPSNLYSHSVVAYCELNSPSRPEGLYLVISELVVVVGVPGSLVVRSVA